MSSLLHIPFAFALVLLLLAISFLFSLSETSIISLSKIKLRNMVSKGVRGASQVQKLVLNLDKFIVAILVGNNFVNIAISAIVTGICVKTFGFNWGVAAATFSTSFLILIFCEITPKMLAIKHTERAAIFAAPLMAFFIKCFYFIIVIFEKISNLIIKLLRIKPAKRSPLITEEELRLMIELGKEEGFLSDEEGKMLHRIFEFGDTEVKDCMVPKEKIVALNIKSTPEEVLNTFVEEGHARLPVYDGSVDNVVGVIYARDLLYIMRDKGLFMLADLVHSVYFAPAKMKVNQLLKEFQNNKIQIAVVTGEHKKTLGLVTLEDLIEEIVGEIEESHHYHKK